MGKNKLKKFDDMNGYHHVFQYPFAVLKEKGFELKGNWNKDFFKNDNPIVLELGCGKGEYAVGLARKYPNKNFIGIDIKGARMWSGAKASLEEGLNNVAFLRTNIELIPHFFGENEISEIWITFPDPQMKKTTKRLTSTRFMQLYLELLKPEGLIHLKCDSNFLFTYTEEMVKANNFPVNFLTRDLYHSDINDDVLLSIQTYYEQQWIERGIDIKYICFTPQKRDEFIEPEVEIELDSYRSFNRSKRSALSMRK